MPHYKCPVENCNVQYEGSVYDIAPMATMHSEGSHKTNMGFEDVARIIEEQSRPKPPVEIVEPPVVLEEPVEGIPSSSVDDSQHEEEKPILDDSVPLEDKAKEALEEEESPGEYITQEEKPKGLTFEEEINIRHEMLKQMEDRRAEVLSEVERSEPIESGVVSEAISSIKSEEIRIKRERRRKRKLRRLRKLKKLEKKKKETGFNSDWWNK